MSVHESHALPWRVVECRPGAWDGDDRCEGIRDADGFRVVTTDSGVYEPNLVTARFIVTACNSHHDLLAALKAVTELATEEERDGADKLWTLYYRGLVEASRAAIAKAGGSTHV